MVLFLPLEVIEETPTLRQFVTSGGNLRSQELDRELKASQERTLSILSAAADAVVVCSESLFIDVFNESAVEMYGFVPLPSSLSFFSHPLSFIWCEK